MEEKNKRRLWVLIKYLISLVVGALFVLMVLFIENYFSATETIERYKILSDAFTFAGVLLILFAALVFISSKGGFDGIGYSLGRLVKMLIPFANRRDETYAQYKERKRAKGITKGYSCVFFSGLAYFAVSIVFLVLYYNV